MLISKTAIVRWNSRIKKHYVDLGYTYTNMNDEFEVSVDDLTVGSSAVVKVKCDYCGDIYETKWQTYIKRPKEIINKDSCINCCELKSRDSIIKKYGSYQNSFFKSNDQRMNTNIEKYGCANPFANKDIKNKIIQYNLETYGVKSVMQLDEFVQKAKQTCIDKYGVDNYSKTKEWRDSNRGENSPVWKGENATTVRSGRELPEYRDWRKSVFIRDHYTCQCCGSKNGNGKSIRFEAHHIKNWKDNPNERYDVDNGITLCLSCHTLFHSNYGKKNNNREQLESFIEEYNKIDKNIC